MPPTSPKPPQDKLEQILVILKRMDRRDRLRTIGGFVRTIIGFVPIAIVVFFTWYTIKYGDQLLQKITSMAAEQAGKVAQQNAVSDFMKEFNQINQKLQPK
ncbi:MAG: hypothetical protein PHX87_04350 [Candidatus Peribacteraceae bacterium]|nr:hypothetical protein [Candidatus Peribacteraceae bacterium]MDD5742630.1 hypothetical protein [Candidatus Peribacteraceae bacterium]